MDVKAGAVDGFLAKPPDNLRLALIYGPDTGLVRERAKRLSRVIVPDAADPFRLVEMTGDQLLADPARLNDEAAAIAFGGGRRVVRIENAGNRQADIVKSFLDNPVGDALIIVEADSLPKSAKLRAAAEKSGIAAALPCYADEGRRLDDVIRESLAAEGLQAAPDTIAYLAENLGNDRMTTRSELTKLALYARPRDGEARGPVTVEEAAACVGDNTALTLQNLADVVAMGDPKAAERILTLIFNEGIAAVGVVRVLSQHFNKLLLARVRLSRGEQAPRVFPSVGLRAQGPRLGQLQAQLNGWSEGGLRRAVGRLLEAETHCKTTGLPANVMCARAVSALAGLGRQEKRRQARR